MPTNKVALVTGVAGQDGSYLAKFLLVKNYQVIGMIRHRSLKHLGNLASILNNQSFKLVEGEMTDSGSLRHVIETAHPTEIYNLAAQSFVGASWNQAIHTNEVNFLGFLKLLDVCRQIKGRALPRIYQASSSEMYGNQPLPQNEETRMTPCSPYGLSKLASHRLVNIYRESFGMFVVGGIMYNHESERRGIEFVTRKIAQGVVRIKRTGKTLELGSLDAKRDWGYAPDYVEAMWLMLQQDEPDDYVIATGETHSVGEFLDLALAHVGKSRSQVEWDSEALKRPAEVRELCGDASKARKKLGWMPKTSFEELVEIMVKSELGKSP
jgi:GDPmannose 4,6-dehydratase